MEILKCRYRLLLKSETRIYRQKNGGKDKWIGDGMKFRDNPVWYTGPFRVLVRWELFQQEKRKWTLIVPLQHSYEWVVASCSHRTTINSVLACICYISMCFRQYWPTSQLREFRDKLFQVVILGHRTQVFRMQVTPEGDCQGCETRVLSGCVKRTC
jgi:hypothetical protein